MKPLFSAEANKLKRGKPMTEDLKESLPPSAPVRIPGSQTESAGAHCRRESDTKIRDASDELSQNSPTTAQSVGSFALPHGPGVLGSQHNATGFPPLTLALKTRYHEGLSPPDVPKLTSRLDGGVDSEMQQADTALSENLHPISELGVEACGLPPLSVQNPRSPETIEPADVDMGEAGEKVGEAEPAAQNGSLAAVNGTPKASAGVLDSGFSPATPETGKTEGQKTAVESVASPNGTLPIAFNLAEPGSSEGATNAPPNEIEIKADFPTPERVLAKARPSVIDTLYAGAGAMLSCKIQIQCSSLTFILS